MKQERPIIVTHHALIRMRQRAITEAEVEHIVRSGAREPDGMPDCWRAFVLWNGRRLIVSFVEKDDDRTGTPIFLVTSVMVERQGR